MAEESFESILDEKRVFPPSKSFARKAHISNLSRYHTIYRDSMQNPEKFWAAQAENLVWFKKWDKVLRKEGDFYKWFEGGTINAAYNCLDRHIYEGRGKKIALIWEPEKGKHKTFTYEELLEEVCQFANTLKRFGLKKGDRACLYMPMIPELAIAVLACARIGVIHSVVFGGFSAVALRDRIQDAEASIVITADGGYRNGKIVELKEHVDNAVKECLKVKTVMVVKRCKNKVVMKKGRDVWWHEEIEKPGDRVCPTEHLDAEDCLFILYTSGTTGKPKGILHTQGGYLLYTYLTFKWIFDNKPKDVYWCTADIGWITGHSYLVYGPLLNGATTVMYEGGPCYPHPDRFWDIVEKHKISVFYTAPTAIRALMKFGDKWVKKHDLSSLRLLGSVGEPINPEAWMWYYEIIGNKKCPIVDTWWQTETGGILLTPLPGATPLKPGSATLPFPGIEADVVDGKGNSTKTDEGGYLVITQPWPGMLRTIWKNPQRYKDTYFSKFKGMYLTGDSARKDKDGYFWILGRLDDVIKVAGHRIGTSEVESHLVSHPQIAEAAVVPVPDEVKGQAIYAFVTVKKGVRKSDALQQDIMDHIAKQMGKIAKPKCIQFADDLPKTRSGKIMRRILKVIAEGRKDVGNTTTLADPSVVDKLLKDHC